MSYLERDARDVADHVGLQIVLVEFERRGVLAVVAESGQKSRRAPAHGRQILAAASTADHYVPSASLGNARRLAFVNEGIQVICHLAVRAGPGYCSRDTAGRGQRKRRGENGCSGCPSHTQRSPWQVQDMLLVVRARQAGTRQFTVVAVTRRTRR